MYLFTEESQRTARNKTANCRDKNHNKQEAEQLVVVVVKILKSARVER